MSSPALQYRILDNLIKENRGGGNLTKNLCHDCDLIRTGKNLKAISCVYRKNSDLGYRATIATVYRNGSINIFHRSLNASYKQWGFRLNKFLSLFSPYTSENEDYLSRLTATDTYHCSLSLHSCAQLPKREMTAEELKLKNDYEAPHPELGWRPYYCHPHLSYGPNYWYNQIATFHLKQAPNPEVCLVIRPAPGKTPGGYWFDTGCERAGNSGLKVLRNYKRLKFYKVMDSQGCTNFSKYQWDMPVFDDEQNHWTPGNWHTVYGPLEFCHRGIHICTIDQIPLWTSNRHNMLVEMEYEGTVLRSDDRPTEKYLVRKARIARIVADLGPFIAQHGVRAYTTSAIQDLKRLTQGKTLTTPQVYLISMKVAYTVTKTVTVYSKKELAKHRHELLAAASHYQPYQGHANLIAKSSKVTLMPNG